MMLSSAGDTETRLTDLSVNSRELFYHLLGTKKKQIAVILIKRSFITDFFVKDFFYIVLLIKLYIRRERKIAYKLIYFNVFFVQK